MPRCKNRFLVPVLSIFWSLPRFWSSCSCTVCSLASCAVLEAGSLPQSACYSVQYWSAGPLRLHIYMPHGFCRIGATRIWTVHLIRSAYVWELEAKDQAAYIDNLLHSLAEGRKTIAVVRKALKDGQTADSVLNHMLKNTMADASGCIDLYCHARPHGEDVDLLSKASDGLFRGMWWCKLREAMLRMVAGQYESQPEVVNLHQSAVDFVRGRDVEFECPLHVVMLDPMACNGILDHAVTNATRHGCRTNPEVKLTTRVSEQSHNADAATIDCPIESEMPVEVRITVTNRADSTRPAVQRWSTQQPNELQQAKSPNSPVLSDGLGLSHIWMVAHRADMVAELWQNEHMVHFELFFQTEALPLDTLLLPQRAGIVSLTPRWEVLGLDDSGIARKSPPLNKSGRPTTPPATLGTPRGQRCSL